jgi:biotin transport system substrate-specific component
MKEQLKEIKEKKITVYQITFMALMAAVMCVLGPLVVPVGPVPISLTNFVIFFAVFVLGMRVGTGSYCLYLLIGMVGVPVFSGYAGGISKLTGPTGGYLLGMIFMALIGGVVLEKMHRRLFPVIAAWGAGTLINYAFGTAWFAYITHVSFAHALAVCVIPFILGDMVKIVAGTLLGKEVRKALCKAGVLG